MSTPVNHLGVKCPCIPFFIGGRMSEGGNVLHSITVCQPSFFSSFFLYFYYGNTPITIFIAVRMLNTD